MGYKRATYVRLVSYEHPFLDIHNKNSMKLDTARS